MSIDGRTEFYTVLRENNNDETTSRVIVLRISQSERHEFPELLVFNNRLESAECRLGRNRGYRLNRIILFVNAQKLFSSEKINTEEIFIGPILAARI